jgi:hypothetical protein
MMYLDPNDPYGGDGGGDTGGTDGTDSGETGGTDPNTRPTFKPTPNGWWEYINGAWRWFTEPAPQVVAA